MYTYQMIEGLIKASLCAGAWRYNAGVLRMVIHTSLSTSFMPPYFSAPRGAGSSDRRRVLNGMYKKST